MFGVTTDSPRLQVGNLSGKSGMHPPLLDSLDHLYWTLGPSGHGDEMDVLLSLSLVFYSSNMCLASVPQS